MPESKTTTISIEVWSDVVCPWCYIGKRRLDAGLAAFAATPDAPEVQVTFRSFQLSPNTPDEFDGSAVDFLSVHLGIPEAQVREMHAHVSSVAASVGLHYDFDAMQMTGTLKAHQVLHLAKDRDVQAQVKERLMHAHFVEGRHIGRDQELADLGADAGLDRGEVLTVLGDERYLSAVQGDLRRAREVGVNGVPFFVIGGRYAVSGAQAPEVFVQALQQVQADGS